MSTAPWLKPHHFVKGQSGNPAGRAKPLFTKADVEHAFQHTAKLPVTELDKIIKDPESAAIDAAIAAVWKRAIIQADVAALDFLLNRSVGKVKDMIEQEITTRMENKALLAGVPTEDLVALKLAAASKAGV